MPKEKVRFLPLGGVGDVTKNMYVYEYFNTFGQSQILVVDCGVGFPDSNMYGVDLVIPDASYLEKKADQVVGFVLTHGHEDHIAALPYIWPKIKKPIFATKLTAALTQTHFDEIDLKAPIKTCLRNETLNLGVFKINFVHMTHSIPDANHLIIKTPLGNFYHGSDFKFDWTPVDNDLPEINKIVEVAQEGVLAATTDCLGADRPGYTPSESVIANGLNRVISQCRGKFIVTTQSSNILRIKQAIDVSLKYGRSVCLVGRSIKQNIKVAQEMGYLKIPSYVLVDERKLQKIPPAKITLIVAGSQGQVESALARIASNDHPFVRIEKNDMVVFSADPIPGNEEAVHSLIDQLIDLGAEISYSEVEEDLHVSGHGSQNDLLFLLALIKPKYLLPIGGTKRHMYHYQQLVGKAGFAKNKVLLLEEGQSIDFVEQEAFYGQKIALKNIMVDGLGIGDVGNIVLRDRQKIAEDGFVVTIIPIDRHQGELAGEIDIISRGFVYMKEAESLIREAKKLIYHHFQKKRLWQDLGYTKKLVEDILEKWFYQKTHRRPMVITVLIEV